VTRVSSLSGADSFPVYRQLPTDNSCGPRCILMVADYFEKERGRKLYAHEWSRVLEVTMENDLARDRGTSLENMIRGLFEVGLRSRHIRGATPEAARKALVRALERDHPVIVNCKIPYRGKPVRHYAVLVAMDDELLRFADPFPHKDCPTGSLRPIPWSEFQANRWSKGATIWGHQRWAVEIVNVTK
jgi:ABC-type bacteriocin/lantibiotic exporter with double-glycine peptidase domain